MTKKFGLKKKRSISRTISRQYVVVHWKTKHMKRASSLIFNGSSIPKRKIKFASDAEKLKVAMINFFAVSSAHTKNVHMPL